MFFYPKRVKAMLVPHFFLSLSVEFFLKPQYPLASQMARLQASTLMKNNALNSRNLSNYYLFLSIFVIVLLENSYFLIIFDKFPEIISSNISFALPSVPIKFLVHWVMCYYFSF